MLVRINTCKVQRPVMSHMLMMSQGSVLHIIHGGLTGHGDTVVTHSPPTSEVCGSNPGLKMFTLQ